MESKENNVKSIVFDWSEDRENCEKKDENMSAVFPDELVTRMDRVLYPRRRGDLSDFIRDATIKKLRTWREEETPDTSPHGIFGPRSSRTYFFNPYRMISFNVSRKLKNLVREYCSAHGISGAEFIRNAVEEEVKKSEETAKKNTLVRNFFDRKYVACVKHINESFQDIFNEYVKRVPELWNCKCKDITNINHRTICQLREVVKRDAGIQANQVWSVISEMFDCAVEQGYPDKNPLKEPPRENKVIPLRIAGNI